MPRLTRVSAAWVPQPQAFDFASLMFHYIAIYMLHT